VALAPRLLTGRALQLSARASQVPLLAAGVRAAARPLLGLSVLHDARLGTTPPALVPPTPQPVDHADDRS
jgi:hypothetical protein